MLRSFRTTKREGSSSLDSSVPTLASAKNENMGLNETFASSPRDHDGQLQEAKEKLDIPKTTSPANHQTESTYLVGMKLYLMLLGVGCTCFLMMLDQTIVVTAIPRITNEFNSVADIGWYGSAYMLCIAALQPLTGKIYQYHNTKTVFMCGVAIFELGSLISALANSSAMLIVGRAISGSGASGLITGFLSILAASVPIDKRPMYMGLVMGVSSLGIVIGPVIGGVFTQHATWRWCFYLNLPFGGITLGILSLLRIPSAASSTGPKVSLKESLNRLDLIGFTMFAPGVIMLLFAFDWGGNKYEWKSATIIGLFCGTVGILAVFLIWEKFRGKNAMIPLALLKNRVLIFASITMIMSQGSLLVVIYYLPLWFQVAKGASPTMGGVYFLPSVGSQIISSIVTGKLTSTLGIYTQFAILGTFLTSLASGLFTILRPTSGPGLWVTFQIINGISRGLTVQQPITALQASLPKADYPIGNSFIMFAQILGGAIFLSLGQLIINNQIGPALLKYAPEVDVKAVLAVGATDFRSVVKPESVAGVVLAYNKAITTVFYLGAGAAAVGFCASWGMGFGNLIKIRKVQEAAAGAAAKEVSVPETKPENSV